MPEKTSARRGRQTGGKKRFTVHLPESLADTVDDLAAKYGVSRSYAAQVLISKAMGIAGRKDGWFK